MIAVVDAGMGNLRSVVRALERAATDASIGSCDVVVTADPDAIARADRVVMPGQGAFGDCAVALGRDGGALAEALRASIAAGRPYLGICLGLQVLFRESDEAPGRDGLGVFEGHVQKFSTDLRDTDGERLKVPHMGWNCVDPQSAWPSWAPAAAQADAADRWFYFVHSYCVVPDDVAVIAGRTQHGETFASAVARANVFAVQFHPEKSQRAGLRLLRAWLAGTA